MMLGLDLRQRGDLLVATANEAGRKLRKIDSLLREP